MPETRNLFIFLPPSPYFWELCMLCWSEARALGTEEAMDAEVCPDRALEAGV